MSCDASGRVNTKNIFYILYFWKRVSCDASGQLETKNIYVIFEKECRTSGQLDTNFFFF